jgi:peptidoglycan/LPS O-acetylase OafA/YrhL
MVLIAHTNPWRMGRFSNELLRANGFHGVDIFFAMSGYLICTRLLREEERFGSISLSSFYLRRLFRIQPAALTYLAVVVLLTLVGAVPAFWPGIVSAALMTRNLWPVHLEPGFWYTEHFWSLAVEEHFYLLLPAFLLLVRRRRLEILLAAMVALAIWQGIVGTTEWLQSGAGWQTAHRTDIAIPGILLGSVFAVAMRYERVVAWSTLVLKPWVAWLYTALVFALAAGHHAYLFQTAVMTSFPVLIVATVLHPQSLTGTVLELAPMRWVWRISYSLYLWQQMFFLPDEANMPRLLSNNAWLWLAVTVVFAVGSYYLVETPFIGMGHRMAKRMETQRESARVGATA